VEGAVREGTERRGNGKGKRGKGWRKGAGILLLGGTEGLVPHLSQATNV